MAGIDVARPARDAAPVACVLGEIDLVRALALAGIRSAVIAPPGDFTRFSRTARVAFDWIDPWRFPDRLVQRMLEFGREQPEKPVLFYDGDWDLLVISRQRERLGEAFRFVVPERDLVERLVDKARFQELARDHDLPVPPAVQRLPAKDSADVPLHFPVVVKPLIRQEETWRPLTRAKSIHAASPSELETLWPSFADAGFDVLVQESIPGPESAIESYHAYVDAHGETVAEFTGRKLRTYPASYGYSTALVITQAEDVAHLGRDITRRLDLRGVAKLDFKRAASGRLFLLEINARFNLWHHPGAKAGVNIPALVYQDLVGLPRGVIGPARPGVRWVSPWRDAVAAHEQGMSPVQWLRWALAAETKCAIAWDDPLPLVCAGVVRAAHRISRRDRDH